MTRRYNGKEKDILDEIVALRKRVAALENGPQLRFTSVKGTSGLTFVVDPETGDVTISGTFRAKTAIAEAILYSGSASPGLYLYSLLTDANPASVLAFAVGSTFRNLQLNSAAPPSGTYSGGSITLQADSSSPGGEFLVVVPRDTTTGGTGQMFIQTGSGAAALIGVTNDDGTDADLFLDGKVWVGTTKVGFYNATPVTQPTITGSRGANAALASLLTALANMGLIINSTT